MFAVVNLNMQAGITIFLRKFIPQTFKSYTSRTSLIRASKIRVSPLSKGRVN